eukprot:3221392-Rhodomonas_salina.6
MPGITIHAYYAMFGIMLRTRYAMSTIVLLLHSTYPPSIPRIRCACPVLTSALLPVLPAFRCAMPVTDVGYAATSLPLTSRASLLLLVTSPWMLRSRFPGIALRLLSTHELYCARVSPYACSVLTNCLVLGYRWYRPTLAQYSRIVSCFGTAVRLLSTHELSCDRVSTYACSVLTNCLVLGYRHMIAQYSCIVWCFGTAVRLLSDHVMYGATVSTYALAQYSRSLWCYSVSLSACYAMPCTDLGSCCTSA